MQGRDERIRQRQERGQTRIDNEIVQMINKLPSLFELKANELNDYAEKFAESISKDLKTAQIRRIFGAVKKMQMEFKKIKKEEFKNDRVILLKPKLAYAANKKFEVRQLQNVLDACIDKIGNGAEGHKDFETFVNFFEAILAYHK